MFKIVMTCLIGTIAIASSALAPSSALAHSSALAQRAPSPDAGRNAEKPKASPTNLPPKPIEPSMRVVLVRSAQTGCEPLCLEWISAQGTIDSATLPQFKKVLKTLGTTKRPILIDSAGGHVDDALAIGRLIRAKQLDVIVTKTIFKPCAPTDTDCKKGTSRGPALGLPFARASQCASSCAFILAGGTKRLVGPTTGVGVHQLTTFQTQARYELTYKVFTNRVLGIPLDSRKELVSKRKISERTIQTKTADATYAKVKRYFVEMGINPSIVPLIQATPASTIHWLTATELASTRMMTDAFNGEQMLTAGRTTPTTPSATPMGCIMMGGTSIGCGPHAVKPETPPQTPPSAVQPSPPAPATE
jgi:hypothetical protein